MEQDQAPNAAARGSELTEGLGGWFRRALNVVRRAWLDISRTLNPWYAAHLLRLENERLLELLADPFISGLHYTAQGDSP